MTAAVSAFWISGFLLDEAQNLDLHPLEQIRLLSNIETQTEKLLQILLVGQPELLDKLDGPELRQLKQRVGLRCRILPLTAEQTATPSAPAAGSPGRQTVGSSPMRRSPGSPSTRAGSHASSIRPATIACSSAMRTRSDASITRSSRRPSRISRRASGERPGRVACSTPGGRR
jgi:hypothetical protein